MSNFEFAIIGMGVVVVSWFVIARLSEYITSHRHKHS